MLLSCVVPLQHFVRQGFSCAANSCCGTFRLLSSATCFDVYWHNAKQTFRVINAAYKGLPYAPILLYELVMSSWLGVLITHSLRTTECACLRLSKFADIEPSMCATTTFNSVHNTVISYHSTHLCIVSWKQKPTTTQLHIIRKDIMLHVLSTLCQLLIRQA